MQVPIAIGGPGLPKEARFRTDLREPGLANVGPTIVNLLGFRVAQQPGGVSAGLRAGFTPTWHQKSNRCWQGLHHIEHSLRIRI